MSFRPNLAEQYTRPNGQLTIEGMKLLQDLFDRVTVLETDLDAADAKLTAIAAVTAPAGGATIDAESRTAINAIIAGAT